MCATGPWRPFEARSGSCRRNHFCSPTPSLRTSRSDGEAPQRVLVFEQQGEPFGMFEGARFGIGLELLEALGHAVQAERVQLVECGMSEHSSVSVS